MKIVYTLRESNRPARPESKIVGKAKPMGQLVIGHKVHSVGNIIVGRIVHAIVNPFLPKFAVQLYECAGVGVVDPTIQPPRLLYRNFKTILFARSQQRHRFHIWVQQKL